MFVLVCMVDFDVIVSLWYCVITRLLCLDVCRCWFWICLSDFCCVVRLRLFCGSVICCVVCFCVTLLLLVWSLDGFLWGVC